MNPCNSLVALLVLTVIVSSGFAIAYWRAPEPSYEERRATKAHIRDRALVIGAWLAVIWIVAVFTYWLAVL